LLRIKTMSIENKILLAVITGGSFIVLLMFAIDWNQSEQKPQPLSIEGIAESVHVDEAQVAGEAEKGIFEIEVLVTTRQDIWIPDSFLQDKVGEVGFQFRITGDVFSGDTSSFISEETSDTETNNRHKVAAGTSETFMLRAELDPETTGVYGVELFALHYSTSSDGLLMTFEVPDDSEFETKKVALDE
jgi:hypothetical protein